MLSLRNLQSVSYTADVWTSKLQYELVSAVIMETIHPNFPGTVTVHTSCPGLITNDSAIPKCVIVERQILWSHELKAVCIRYVVYTLKGA